MWRCRILLYLELDLLGVVCMYSGSQLSFARISSTRATLPTFPSPVGIWRSMRVPMRMSVAIRWEPLAWTAAWQSWIAWETLDQGPSAQAQYV